jgi:DNA modification methylase
VLQTLPAGSVQVCVTSPHYYGLRDYGVAGQIGLEKSPDEYVAQMVAVFREVRRTLRDDGTLWLNLGDSYSGGGGFSPDAPSNRNGQSKQTTQGSRTYKGRQPALGYKSKDLLGIPWRVAFALQADGWWLRSEIIWHKPNPMPESVRDRPTSAHEKVFLFAQSERYFYDARAVREPFADERMGNPGIYKRTSQASKGSNRDRQDTGFLNNGAGWNTDGRAAGRNICNVWTITPKPYAGAHFAVMPPALPSRAAAIHERSAVCPPRSSADGARAEPSCQYGP